MSTARQSAQTLFYSITYVFLTIVNGIIAARVLGPVGKGQAAVAVTMPLLVAFMVNMGLPSSVVYFIGQKDSRPREFFVIATVLSVLVGGTASVLIWVFRGPALATIFRGLTPEILLVSLASVPLTVYNNTVMAVLTGRLLIWEYNKTQIAQAVCTVILTALFLLVFRWGVMGAVLAVAIGAALRGLLSAAYVARFIGIDLRVKWSLGRRMVAYGWQAYLGNAVSMLNNRLDIYILNVLAGNYAVGIYSLSVNFAEMMYQVPEALRLVIHPKLVASREYADRATPKACRQIVMICLAMSILGIVFCKPAIALLYGKRFLPATLPFVLLLPGVVLFSVSRILFADLQSRGRPILTAYGSIIGLVPKVALNFVLVPVLQSAGAAIASSIGYGVGTIYLAGAFSKLSGVRAREIVAIGKEDFKVYKGAAGKLRGMLRRRTA